MALPPEEQAMTIGHAGERFSLPRLHGRMCRRSERGCYHAITVLCRTPPHRHAMCAEGSGFSLMR
jgi:hypothetical protein